MINRFRSRAQRRYIAFGQCYVEPIVRQSIRGTRYWSILEDENSQFLDQLGYYAKGPRRPSLKADSNVIPGRRRSGWACVKALAKSPCPVVDVSKTDDVKSPTQPVSTAKDDEKSPTRPVSATTDMKISPADRSRRRASVGVIKTEISQDDHTLPIPPRFMSRPSICFSPQGPILRPVAESGAEPQPRIPTIEINNQSDRVLGRHSDHSGFEWYQSSSFSSSTTDDMTSPSSGDNYLQRLEEIRSARVATSPDEDVDRLFVRVSSDAASTVSSQTLVEGNGLVEMTAAEATTSTPKIDDSHADRIKQRRVSETHRADPDSFEIEEVRLKCYPISA